MKILNFAHPLSPIMLEQIAALLNVKIQTLEELRITTQIDRTLPIQLEMTRILESTGFSNEDWQTKPFIVNPPGLALAALCLITELHGRTGYFPSVLSVSPIPNSTPLEFMVQGVVNLQQLREIARMKR